MSVTLPKALPRSLCRQLAGIEDVVWFKKDLRVLDHPPLVEASQRGPVVACYLLEPSLLGAPDADALHWNFARQALEELADALALRGAPLLVLHGEAVECFAHLRESLGFKRLWSHEETGNTLTYRRDRAVAVWSQNEGISWQEYPNNAVVRALRNRDTWSAEWNRRMRPEPLDAPAKLGKWRGPALPLGALPPADALKLTPFAERTPTVQKGGTSAGLRRLDAFLNGRGRDYSKRMSSPATAWSSCSRLSPYLTHGCVSMRMAVHLATDGLARLKAMRRAERPIQLGSVSAFLGRCHWHCHFIQKLESEPRAEHSNFHRGFEGLRDDGPSDDVLAQFLAGQTGFPFVDACLRSLRATGWINFRMRAMLTSFAAFPLWLDWRRFRDPLARCFIDYEPGIHISQLQMQSGVTGINTVRIYNPIKQGLDHDPDGSFTRRWVPEVAALPSELIHTPWKAGAFMLEAKGIQLGRTYPKPMIDLSSSLRQARAKLGAARRADSFRSENQRVYQKHGSRKGSATRRHHGRDAAIFNRPKPTEPPKPKSNQLELFP